MNLIFPYILFTCFIIAVYISAKQCKKEALKYPENIFFLLMSIFSAIWSLGIWTISIQMEIGIAYIFRAIGMVGMFSYLIVAQLFVCYLSGTMQSYFYPIVGVSFMGLIICLFNIKEDYSIYKLSIMGMPHQSVMGFWNIVCVIYGIVISVNIFVSIIYMFGKSRRKRMRVLAKKLLLTQFIIVLGIVFDVICPWFNTPPFFGSTVGQCLGLLATYRTLTFINSSRITIGNMSTYVYSSLNTPILVFDDNYKLQLLNDVAYDFIGLKETEIKNADIDSLFSVKEEESLYFDGKQKDIDVVCNYNQAHCNISISKIHDDYYDVIGYIVAVTDLSERMEYIKRLEYAIQEVENALQEAKNANQAKTTFLANMSHEIRTPMNAVIGFAELALKKDISSEVREYIEGIRLASHNLLAIINDILDITKIESGKMEIIPGNYFVADLLDDVSLIISQQAMKKGLAFVMKTDTDIPTQLFGDKVRLRGILINILNNAVKYTKEGTVSFEVKSLSRTEEEIWLSFVISDTGIGIKPEDKDNLFKSFERLDQQVHYGVEGSGLGLAIAKGYVTLMGGEITVDSVYGEGSVFTVSVNQKIIDSTPLQHQFTIDRVKHEEPSEKITVHDICVLLVDDNHINLQVAKGLLESYGLSVDTASGGAAAIDLCRATHYPIIFMDQMMPEIDGIEAMQQIRQLDSYYAPGGEGKIIVLTADAIRGSRENLLAKGFDEYLGKPMNLKRLEQLMMLYIPADKITVSEPTMEIENGQEEEIKYLREKLPDVDILLGLKNCGGTVADYLSVLKINYSYGNKNLEELEALLLHKDYQNYTIKIHAIKSTTKGIGALAVSEMARKHEEAGRAGEYAYIDAHFDTFKTEYEAQLQGIEEVLSHYHMLDESVAADSEVLDSEMLGYILSNIQNQVEAFAFGKVFEILENVKQYRLPEDYQELFDRLEAAMNDLAVDDVRKLLHDALAELESK